MEVSAGEEHDGSENAKNENLVEPRRRNIRKPRHMMHSHSIETIPNAHVRSTHIESSVEE